MNNIVPAVFASMAKGSNIVNVPELQEISGRFKNPHPAKKC